MIGPTVLGNQTNLKYLHLINNDFKDVPAALWHAPLLDAVFMGWDKDTPSAFDCSCSLLNDLKQLGHRVRLLDHIFLREEGKFCEKLTNKCGKDRDFALGMGGYSACRYPFSPLLTDGQVDKGFV